MSFVQYLKDTRGELHHVAWPTRVQTVIYTVLVVVVSIFTALYLGFFDYIFTTGLGKIVETLPSAQAPAAEIVDVETEPVTTETPVDINSIVPDAQ
jgi:preprotein translocase SecE subunit